MLPNFQADTDALRFSQLVQRIFEAEHFSPTSVAEQANDIHFCAFSLPQVLYLTVYFMMAFQFKAKILFRQYIKDTKATTCVFQAYRPRPWKQDSRLKDLSKDAVHWIDANLDTIDRDPSRFESEADSYREDGWSSEFSYDGEEEPDDLRAERIVAASDTSDSECSDCERPTAFKPFRDNKHCKKRALLGHVARKVIEDYELRAMEIEGSTSIRANIALLKEFIKHSIHVEKVCRRLRVLTEHLNLRVRGGSPREEPMLLQMKTVDGDTDPSQPSLLIESNFLRRISLQRIMRGMHGQLMVEDEMIGRYMNSLDIYLNRKSGA